MRKFFIAILVVLVTAGFTVSSYAEEVPEKGKHGERAPGAKTPNGPKKIPVQPAKPKRVTPAGASAGAPTPSSPPNAPNRIVPGGSSPGARVPILKKGGVQGISSPSSPPSPSSPSSPPSCGTLQQNMNSVQNKTTLLKNFMTNINSPELCEQIGKMIKEQA